MLEYYIIIIYYNNIIYYNIIILWDQRHIRGPSLTETSLCGAWLHFKSRSTYQIIRRNPIVVKKQIWSYQRLLQIVFLYVGFFCFWMCVGIIENKSDCRKSGFNVCISHHFLLRWGNSWFNQQKNICFFYCFVFVCLFVFSLFASPSRPWWLVLATECVFSYWPALSEILSREPNWSHLAVCRHPLPH